MILRPLRNMDLSTLFLLLLSFSIPVSAFEDPFDCHFQVNNLKYDLNPLAGEHVVTRARETPPTREVDSVRISLCSDLERQKDVSDGDQCPSGTRVCLTKTNSKDGSDRIVSVVPIAQTSTLNPSYAPLSSAKGVSILMHGGSYSHPINTTTDVEQSVNITLLCAPDSDPSEPKFLSYDGVRLDLEWSSSAGCGFAAGEDEKNGESPGNGGSSGSGSLSSVGWFLLLLVVGFALYMGLGAYYNYSTYGASGIDLIPHREFFAEVPYMLRDVVSHLCSTVRPRRSSSHRGGYIAV
ncbi:Autophagy-related protein 27 [Mycena venus]|uniref:Autophagy-related protein 27 n=1 Tax=Mycena venus TaxID=2733690 RepID=A0A8H7D7P3_9AGAR|nr:Autophagy-related protein 27 [Mycena venus]